jgi:hypothetical protein
VSHVQVVRSKGLFSDGQCPPAKLFSFGILFSCKANFRQCHQPGGQSQVVFAQPLLRTEQGAAHQRLGTSVIPLIEDRQVVVGVG